MSEVNVLPLVSVIIPTYNRGWTLCEAIDSVLAQDYSRVEIIVVDDGSSDNTPEILDNYRDKIKVLRQENQGVSAARNVGIKASTGEFVALLDSDDVWQKKKLTEQIAFFKNNPDAQICQTEEIWIRNGKRVNPKIKHKKPSGMIFEASLHLCLVSPSAVMMRRTIFEKYGYFDESLPACEDYDLWLRISCETPIYITDSKYVIKRGGHADQLSSAPGLDKYRIKAIEKLLKSGRLTNAQYEAAYGVLSEKCRIYAAGCLKRGKTGEGDTYHNLPDLYQNG